MTAKSIFNFPPTFILLSKNTFSQSDSISSLLHLEQSSSQSGLTSSLPHLDQSSTHWHSHDTMSKNSQSSNETAAWFYSDYPASSLFFSCMGRKTFSSGGKNCLSLLHPRSTTIQQLLQNSPSSDQSFAKFITTKISQLTGLSSRSNVGIIPSPPLAAKNQGIFSHRNLLYFRHFSRLSIFFTDEEIKEDTQHFQWEESGTPSPSFGNQLRITCPLPRMSVWAPAADQSFSFVYLPRTQQLLLENRSGLTHLVHLAHMHRETSVQRLCVTTLTPPSTYTNEISWWSATSASISIPDIINSLFQVVEASLSSRFTVMSIPRYYLLVLRASNYLQP